MGNIVAKLSRSKRKEQREELELVGSTLPSELEDVEEEEEDLEDTSRDTDTTPLAGVSMTEELGVDLEDDDAEKTGPNDASASTVTTSSDDENEKDADSAIADSNVPKDNNKKTVSFNNETSKACDIEPSASSNSYADVSTDSEKDADTADRDVHKDKNKKETESVKVNKEESDIKPSASSSSYVNDVTVPTDDEKDVKIGSKRAILSKNNKDNDTKSKTTTPVKKASVSSASSSSSSSVTIIHPPYIPAKAKNQSQGFKRLGRAKKRTFNLSSELPKGKTDQGAPSKKVPKMKVLCCTICRGTNIFTTNQPEKLDAHYNLIHNVRMDQV